MGRMKRFTAVPEKAFKLWKRTHGSEGAAEEEASNRYCAEALANDNCVFPYHQEAMCRPPAAPQLRDTLLNPECRPFRKPFVHRRLQGLATGETPRTANRAFQTQNVARASIPEHTSTTWARRLPQRQPHRHSQLYTDPPTPLAILCSQDMTLPHSNWQSPRTVVHRKLARKPSAGACTMQRLALPCTASRPRHHKLVQQFICKESTSTACTLWVVALPCTASEPRCTSSGSGFCARKRH